MSNPSTALSIIPRSWNGALIPQRPGDAYINATAMCKATGKKLDRYLKAKHVREFLGELRADAPNGATDLVQIRKGGEPGLQGTWVHPEVAIHLAQWCSAKFAVQVSRWVLEILTNPAAAPVDMDRLARAVAGMLLPSLQGAVSAEVWKLGTPLLEHFASAVRPKDPTDTTKRRLCAFILKDPRTAGRCPCCFSVPVVSRDGYRLRNTEWNRYKGVHRRSISEVWLVCSDCGLMLRTDEQARAESLDVFNEFQRRRLRFDREAVREEHQLELDLRAAMEND